MRLLFFMFFLVSCPSSNISTTTPDTMKVKNGDTFTIRIPSSVGTGYTWQFNDSTNQYVTLLSKRYEEGTKNADGEPGNDVFSFKAKKSGTTSLTFIYVRPWEKGRPPSKERSFSITID